MEPISKATLVHRAVVELSAFFAASAFAFSVTTSEVSIGFMIVTGVIGVVVWLVRLEGRINTQAAIMERVERRQEDSATHLSDVKVTIAKIAVHIGVDE